MSRSRATGRTRKAILSALLLLAVAAQAQIFRQAEAPAFRAGDRRPPDLKDLGYEQQLNAPLPLQLKFRDEAGREVELQQYFGTRPVVLNLVYFTCPALCNEALSGLGSALLPLKFTAGKEFEIVTVSIDPADTPEGAAIKKQYYLSRYRRLEADEGWHFLTGSQKNIDAVARAVGFRYRYDETSRQYFHGTGVVVLTPDGRISRYLLGLDYAPRDLKFALMEASEKRIGSLADQAQLFCYHYDPSNGRYSLLVLGSLRGAGALTVLVLGGFIGLMLRREKSQSKRGRTA